MALKQRRD